jgi:triosephosphate isomerase
MKSIFVNLKRFDVPRSMGGICPQDDPQEWIASVMEESVQIGLGSGSNIHLTYLLPEGLIASAKKKLASASEGISLDIEIGCQGLHWKDIMENGNFGAFTSILPARAAKNLGCTWAIIGHSEERRAKHEILEMYESNLLESVELRERASDTVNRLINNEVSCALGVGLNVLLCIGETSEEKGAGDFEDQKHRIQHVLRSQLLSNLRGVKDRLGDQLVAIGYEPIWAIGPGKTPPGKEYISFVTAYIKEVLRNDIDIQASVVYGGGLKEENAGMLAGIDTLDGGLIALTRFTGEIGFDVQGLKGIVDTYLNHLQH